MNVDRLIIELQKLQHANGNVTVRVEPPKGPISMASPVGHIWEVKKVVHDWGVEIIIVAG
jgi:hypothetical protein